MRCLCAAAAACRGRKHYEERKKCVYTGVVTGTVRTADFRGFNDKKQALINAGVKITGPGSSVAQDLEPEFTTFSEDESIAFTSLQVSLTYLAVVLN
jgi:hypothetical protein